MYNATAVSRDETGKLCSFGVVEIDVSGIVIRSNGHWSHESGTAAFEKVWLAGRFSFEHATELFDGTQLFVELFAAPAAMRESLLAELKPRRVIYPPCASCGRDMGRAGSWRNWCSACMEDKADSVHVFVPNTDGNCRDCGYPLRTNDVSHYIEEGATR